MKLNICLIWIGIATSAIAFYRMGVVKIDRKLFIDLAPLVLALLILMHYTHRIGGTKMTMEGLAIAGKMVIAYTPMLVVMFLVMGEAMAIVALYKSGLTTYLSGTKGLFGSLVSAFIMPGSLTSMPIVKDLWYQGASKGPLLVFLITSPLIGWQIMLIRQPILGWKITGIMFVLNSLISIMITLVTWTIMTVV